MFCTYGLLVFSPYMVTEGRKQLRFIDDSYTIEAMEQELPPPKGHLRTFNNVLSWIVVALAVYIIVYPLWPNITYWWNNMRNHHPALVEANNPAPKGSPAPPERMPADNTLVIPGMNFQEIVYEGPSAAVLNQGLWHRPASSTPDRGGNTVIAGHRFTYRGAAVFYHLDKVQIGDKIVLYWQGKKYQYQVMRSYVVLPSAIEVEAATSEPRLTLYTCTPLWTSNNRLVIEAKQVGSS